MIIEKSSPETIKSFILRALLEDLYVEGFSLKFTLQKLLNKKNIDKHTCFYFLKESEAGPVVGLSSFINSEICTIQTFIKPEFRRKGYAKVLIKEILKDVPKKNKHKISFAEGDVNSLFMFKELMAEGLISKENFVSLSTFNRVKILDNLLYCGKNNLNISLYNYGWEESFNAKEIEIINKKLVVQV